MVLRELAIGFTGGLICLNLLWGILFFRLYVKRERQNKLFLGITLFFVFVAVSRIFYLIFDFFQTNFNPVLFETYFLTWRLASAFILFGFGCLLLVADYNLFQGKDKYLVPIFYAIIAVVIVSLPTFELAEQFSTYSIFIAVLFIPLAYLYTAITSSGEIRRKSLWIFFGIVLFGGGLIITAQFIIDGLALGFGIPLMDMRYILHITAALFKAAGGVILYKGFK